MVKSWKFFIDGKEVEFKRDDIKEFQIDRNSERTVATLSLSGEYSSLLAQSLFSGEDEIKNWFKGGYAWWTGHNDEWYSEMHDTKEDALLMLEEYDGEMHICEARTDIVPLSRWLIDDIDWMLERADENACDDGEYWFEDGESLFDGITSEQKSDLESRLKETIDRWQIDNKLMFKGNAFSDMRNQEFITDKSE